MATNNPIIGRMAAQAGRGGYLTDNLQQTFDAPARGGLNDRMTINDVVEKTVVLFAILLGGAAVGWFSLSSMTVGAAMSLIGISALVAFALAMVNTFSKAVRPALAITYAVFEGVVLGGVSRIYAHTQGSHIVSQAVMGTLVTFGVMLFLYTSKIIKVTGKFARIFTIAMVSYGAIALASFVASFFNVGGGWGFYGVGQLGLLLCVAGVALAAFSLVMDFEAIAQSVNYGAPRSEAWRGAFGLLVTLVWLYLELLRLLAILNDRR